MKASGPEDAEFREQVDRSREAARKGWRLAAVLWIGPALSLPVLLALSGRFEAAGIALVVVAAFLGIPFAAALGSRRPPT